MSEPSIDPADLPFFADDDEPQEPAGRVRSSFSLNGHQNKESPQERPIHVVPEPTEPDNKLPEGSAFTADHGAGLDWVVVAALRKQAAERLGRALGDSDGRIDLDDAAREEQGRAVIEELLQERSEDDLTAGRTVFSVREQRALAEATFNALFRLGRLQPLVDDSRIENIMICGYDQVWIEYVDGTLERGPRVAESNEELVEFLAFVATRSANPRSFSFARPVLHQRLPDGSRLAAAAWVTSTPAVVIRRHTLMKATLDDLVAKEMLSPVAASFLSAAINAGLSIVVSGPQNSGKTVMMRCLCREIPPWEKLGTFETEFELHLKEVFAGERIVHEWEERPGSEEKGTDGRPAGQYTVAQGLMDSRRFNLDRQIVGEVGGPEIWAMIKAMENGSGSLCTTHSKNAEATLHKLATCAGEVGIEKSVAIEKLALAVDVIVQLKRKIVPVGDGGTRKVTRWVSEIQAVQPGEDSTGYALTPVFVPGPDGRCVPETMPEELRQDLVDHGFDVDAYVAERGTIGRAGVSQ
ncbi:CpaF family protein [Ornithinimicrobium murale]|uniref:CpaF family protein n=1 Tax=Ornithinimicrobium murale TaxID=1050153 RepID=UPI000E0DC370|nr:ATPase, T2SS/T4P/T4SS family [Ornithinimicrobium murale]